MYTPKLKVVNQCERCGARGVMLTVDITEVPGMKPEVVAVYCSLGCTSAAVPQVVE